VDEQTFIQSQFVQVACTARLRGLVFSRMSVTVFYMPDVSKRQVGYIPMSGRGISLISSMSVRGRSVISRMSVRGSSVISRMSVKRQFDYIQDVSKDSLYSGYQ
jgi:maleate cis-trans isomerase